MVRTFCPMSQTHLKLVAKPDVQSRFVTLLVSATNGLAQNDLSLVEFHGVEVSPPLFSPLTISRMVIATGGTGRGIFVDAAARAGCRAPGLFCSENARNGLVVIQIPNLILNDRPSALTVCEVLARMGALSLAELVIPETSADPGIVSAAQQCERALRAGESPVLLAADERVTERVLSHVSDAAGCLIRKRSLIELFHPSAGERSDSKHGWFRPFSVLTDADFLLTTAGQPARYTQRRLARELIREPHLLTACVTGDTACAVQDPVLARQLVWIPVETCSHGEQTTHE